MLLFCIIIVLTIFILFRKGTLNAPHSSRSYLLKPSVIAGMVFFTLWVGLRYNMKADIDFAGYCDIVESGPSGFYYSHLEIIPKLCVFISIIFSYTIMSFNHLIFSPNLHYFFHFIFFLI